MPKGWGTTPCPSGALLKGGYHGTFHHMSPEHLGRYVAEFEGRHNDRSADTLDQMNAIVRGIEGKRIRYTELIGHKAA